MDRIGIIGFGFSGLMVVANAVRSNTKPCMFYIIDDSSGWGAAYSTTNPDHLLNVRASGMSAFADAPDDFVEWLKGPDAAQAMKKYGLTKQYGNDDFAPRMLYGAYLDAIWRDTQNRAADKNFELKLVPSRAVAVQKNGELLVLTARGDAIAVDRLVLAVGHEVKPIFTHIQSPNIIQNPWAADALHGVAQWPSPVMLVGTGLTAVDMVLSLRRAGYQGEIAAASWRGLIPQIHATPTAVLSLTPDEIAAQKNLQQLIRFVRNKIRVVGDWRVVVDALRAHTQTIWQRLSTPDQLRFLARISPAWSTHRHRMAPEIAARIAAAKVHIIASKKMDVRLEEECLMVTCYPPSGLQHISPSRIINCTGLELNLARSSNPLLRQLLADGLVEPHANGLGVAADHTLHAWGRAHPNLYVIGSLLTGQLLESTAVPELRMQASVIAKQLV